MPINHRKLYCLDYQVVNDVGDKLGRFDTIPDRDSVTDGRTDRQIPSDRR